MMTHKVTPSKMPKKEKLPFEKWLLVVFSVATSIMVFLAMLNLIPEQGAIGIAKAAIIACSAGLVSYAINRFSISWGAELAATGFSLATIVSIFSILFVGTGLFASTYPGLTISSVNELQLQQYGQDLSRYVNARNEQVTQATRTIPVVNASGSDFRAYKNCEEKSSCLSGRGNGGRGTVTRKLEEIAIRADEISKQLTQGDVSRQSILGELNALVGNYQTTLSASDKALSERRQILTRIVAETEQSLSALDEAVPVALLHAYAQELETGVTIAERPTSTKAVNALLSKHGRSLGSVLSSIEDKVLEKPIFPTQAGVSASFTYIGHFLPIAALTACVELILPLSLWVFTFLGIVWEKHLHEPEQSYKTGGKNTTSNDNSSKVVPLNRNGHRNKRRHQPSHKYNRKGDR